MARSKLLSPSTPQHGGREKTISQRKPKTRAGLVMSNTLDTRHGKGLNWEVCESLPCPYLENQPLCKPLMVCGAEGRDADILIPALSFLVTDIHVLAPGFKTDEEVNRRHFFLPFAPS